VLTGLYVSQFVLPPEQVPFLRPENRLDEVLGWLTSNPCNSLPVVDAEKRLLGVLALDEAHLAAQSTHSRSMILAADLMRTDVEPLHLDDRVDRALELFVENDLTALPVVDRSPDRKVLGVVKRSDISNAYLRHVHGVFEETALETHV
jgi:CBS domain-containing protein